MTLKFGLLVGRKVFNVRNFQLNGRRSSSLISSNGFLLFLISKCHMSMQKFVNQEDVLLLPQNQNHLAIPLLNRWLAVYLLLLQILCQLQNWLFKGKRGFSTMDKMSNTQSSNCTVF